jgi:hypothetical protein
MAEGQMNNARLRASLIVGLALVVGACDRDPMTQVLGDAEKVRARDWSHLAGLPEPQLVLSSIGHDDPLVATVRQCQVLTKLHELLADDPLFAPRELGSLPERGVQLRDGYRTLVDRDLYPRFVKLHRSSGDAAATWRQACEGRAPQWREQSIGDQDWLALLVPPSREVAERQLAVYASAVPAAAMAREAQQQARIAGRTRERVLAIGIGIVIMLLGVFMMRKGWRIQRALDKYEFEHRNVAGVVEFESHDAALRHRRRKYFANQFLLVGGGLVVILGALFFLARLTG